MQLLRRSPISGFRSIALLLWLLSAIALSAADVSVKAKLSHRAAEVGEPIQLEIEINGSEGGDEPPDVSVDGLDISYTGPSRSRQIQVINGRMTQTVSTIHLYQVVPKREGEFTIPAVSIEVDGRNYQTQAVTLKVAKGGGNGGNGNDAVGFAEIEVSKKSAYIGEMVPIEFRLYLRANSRPEIGNAPNLAGDGFTVQKMPNPEEQHEMRNGVDYIVVVFRTVLTPSKAGKLTVGPGAMPFVAQVPQQRRNRRRDSFFDDFFQQSFAERRRFEAKAPAVDIEVKTLPIQGRPKDFSGAVGQFDLVGDGSPSRIKVGDPVTMRLKVSGEGNFDRVSAPALVDPEGWQPYNASDQFQPGNDMNTSGIKTFEIPVIATAPHKSMPQYSFTYFDPKAERYMTLKTKPESLVVDGGAPPAPAPVLRADAQNQTQPAEPPAPADATKPTGPSLSGIRYEVGTVGTFAPFYQSRWFLGAQLVPALMTVGLIGFRLARRDPAKTQRASLAKERAELWRRVRRSHDRNHFYDSSVRLLQVDTAIRGGHEPGGVDATLVIRICQVGADVQRQVEEIFEARGALLFAGGAGGHAEIPHEERERVIATLQQVCKV